MLSISLRSSVLFVAVLMLPACDGGVAPVSGDGGMDASGHGDGGGDASTTDGGGHDGGGDDASTTDSGAIDGSAIDAGGTDSGGSDAGGSDAGGLDAGADAGATDAGTDAARIDAGPVCGAMGMGACPTGLMCLGCPSGPIGEHFLCTTSCSSDTDCTDASRPHCNREMFGGGGTGLCTPMTFVCTWGVVCASPDTAIATPDGERPIASLHEGDVVYSVDHDSLRAVPVLLARSVEAEPNHQVVRVTLASGRVVEMSPGHPTADGRVLADLHAGDVLDGTVIVSAEWVPFEFERTYDILPASDTGTYVASGVLVGSTLWQPIATTPPP